MISLPWQGNSEATWTHDSASCPRMAVPMRLSSWLCLDWREWTGIIWYLRSVSHASVLVTVCFSGSGDSFSGSGDRLFQWFWWLLHWVWWQSVSVVLVTVCFTGSGDSLVLCQHHEVEENELTSSGLGGSLSASRVWREGADFFWFGRYPVSIMRLKRQLILSYLDLFVFLSASWGWRDWADIVIFGFVCFSVSIVRLKRLSWYCHIWICLFFCQHREVEETELILSDLDLFVFLSALWGWRDWADIVIFGFVCFSVSIVRLKRLSWYCHIWICLFFCQHREVEETELILSYLDLFVFLSASWGWRDWADIVIFGFVCFSVSIVRLKRLSWYCLIWICLFFCQHREVEETELILSDLEGTLSASQVSKNELISSDLGGSLMASWVWREWDGIWHGRSFICVFVSAWWSAIWSVVIYIICISIVFWCQLFQLDYEMNMPRAHLRKGALRPHFCYYYCLRVLGCRKGFDALVFGRCCLMYSFSLFVFPSTLALRTFAVFSHHDTMWCKIVGLFRTKQNNISNTRKSLGHTVIKWMLF